MSANLRGLAAPLTKLTVFVVVTVLVTAVLAPIVVAVTWLWYRPLVSAGVLVLGFAIAYGVRALAARRHARAAPAPA